MRFSAKVKLQDVTSCATLNRKKHATERADDDYNRKKRNPVFLTGLRLGKNSMQAKREQALAPTKRGLSPVSRVR